MVLSLLALASTSPAAVAQDANQDANPNAGQPMARVLEIAYTPAARAQVAIWVEDGEGRFVATVALTEAVAYRGIGNRPGASQLNSSYRYPYGRREGALPIWAHRRAAAPDARLFPRVVFQDRIEGFASRSVPDASPDDYYCLQFDRGKATRDALDAVSCATQFSSDKGRYLTEADVAEGYAEPFQAGAAPDGMMQPLPLWSVYPPRMDVSRCVDGRCNDHPDVDRLAADARAAMPEIDAVTRATAPGGVQQRILFPVSEAWTDGEYLLWLEINVEGDYNGDWNDTRFPTPQSPNGFWDYYAEKWGYPYRGQPSIAFALPFTLSGTDEASFATDLAAGRSSWDHWAPDYGRIHSVDTIQVDNPGDGMSTSDGSGIDRLARDADGARLSVSVRPVPEGTTAAVGPVADLRAERHDNDLRSHEWVRLHFTAAAAERGIHNYQVRVAREPIADEAAFIMHGRPAKQASDAVEGAAELIVPTHVPAGQSIDVVLGDLVASSEYHIGVRAQDDLGRVGPLRVTTVTTSERHFTTVSPCFIATATYGSPLASQVSVLRQVRDRYLLSHAPGRALVSAYYALGPHAARAITASPRLRAAVRKPLSALVWLAQLVTDGASAPRPRSRSCATPAR